MPYIRQADRDFLDPQIVALARSISSVGELNYAITRLISDFASPLSYERIALVTGVLENVKQEHYRRVASPYEDSKIEANGDVY